MSACTQRIACRVKTQVRRYSTSPVESLLNLAVPLVKQHGFTAYTIQQASLELGGSGYSLQTINQLFPSSPPSTLRKPLNRNELIVSAAGGFTPEERERLGPVKALVEAWLEQGRKETGEFIRQRGFKGQQGIREGLLWRLNYNEPVLDDLASALAVLGVSSDLPVPNPFKQMEHVGAIAHEVACASGDSSQGVDWYKTRTYIGGCYAASELALLSPLGSLSKEERLAQATKTLDGLLNAGEDLSERAKWLKVQSNFIIGSWKGIARSLL